MRLAGKGFEIFVFGSATALLCLVIIAASIGWQGGDTGKDERVASAAEVCGLAENLAGRAAVLESDAPAAGLEGQVRALLDESMALGRKITEWRNADTRDASKAEGLADAAGTLAKTVAAMESDLPEIERSTRGIDRARDLADDMIRILLYDLAVEASPRRAGAGIIPADGEEPRLLLFVPALSELLEALAERPAQQLAVPPLVAAASEGQGLAGALSAFNKAAADYGAVADGWRVHRRALARAREELRAKAGTFAGAAITMQPRDNTERLWSVAIAAAVVWFAVGLVLLLLSILKGEDAPPRARRDATAAPRRRAIERTH